jgi:hypothetical protein
MQLFTNRMGITCVAMALVALLAPRSSADTVIAKLTGVDYASTSYTTVQLTLADSSNPTINNTQAIVGPEHWHQTGGTLNIAGDTGDFTTFCIEIMQDVIINSTYTFNVGAVKDAPTPGALVVPYSGANHNGAMGQTKADLIGKLWALHHADTLVNNLANMGDKAAGAAAFQTAIWEIVYENSGAFSLSTGDLKASQSGSSAASGKAITIAGTWLTQLSDSTPYTAPNLRALSSAGYQDQIFDLPVPPPASGTPLPSAACGGLALFGLAAAVRRRRTPRHI